jgi:hypothetical protein
MTTLTTGDLECTRARLFPLPYYQPMVYTWRSSNRSARIKSRLSLLQSISIIANRVIFTLNRLYSSPSALAPPCVHTMHRKQLKLFNSPFTGSQPSGALHPAATADPLRPPSVEDHGTMLDCITPTSASRHQRRLMLYLRRQSASLVRQARGSEHSLDFCELDPKRTQDIIASYQFVESAPHRPHSRLPNQQSPTSTSSPSAPASSAGASSAQRHTSMVATSKRAPFRPRPHYVNVKGHFRQSLHLEQQLRSRRHPPFLPRRLQSCHSWRGASHCRSHSTSYHWSTFCLPRSQRHTNLHLRCSDLIWSDMVSTCFDHSSLHESPAVDMSMSS